MLNLNCYDEVQTRIFISATIFHSTYSWPPWQVSQCRFLHWISSSQMSGSISRSSPVLWVPRSGGVCWALDWALHYEVYLDKDGRYSRGCTGQWTWWLWSGSRRRCSSWWESRTSPATPTSETSAGSWPRRRSGTRPRGWAGLASSTLPFTMIIMRYHSKWFFFLNSRGHWIESLPQKYFFSSQRRLRFVCSNLMFILSFI